MNFKNLSLLILAFGLIMTSCGDSEGDPTVTITGPAAGANFGAGDAITMLGTATDDVEVSTLRFESATSALSLSDALDLSGVTDKSNFSWQATINLDAALAAGEYQIDVVATDADGNQGSDSLTFNIQ